MKIIPQLKKKKLLALETVPFLCNMDSTQKKAAVVIVTPGVCFVSPPARASLLSITKAMISGKTMTQRSLRRPS